MTNRSRTACAAAAP